MSSFGIHRSMIYEFQTPSTNRYLTVFAVVINIDTTICYHHTAAFAHVGFTPLRNQ